MDVGVFVSTLLLLQTVYKKGAEGEGWTPIG